MSSGASYFKLNFIRGKPSFGLHSSINLNGHYIGTDKLGHFIDDAYWYYKHYKDRSDPEEGLQKAFRYGDDYESTVHGLNTTGIYSYADLASNYSGLQFWISLTEGAKPYFSCKNGVWKKVRIFDWAEYVTPAWDEAINCSRFSEALGPSVVAKTEELEE